MNLADEIEKRIKACSEAPHASDGGILLPWKIRAESELSRFLDDHAANIVDALRRPAPEANASIVQVLPLKQQETVTTVTPMRKWVKAPDDAAGKYINAAPGCPVWFIAGDGQVWLYCLPDLPSLEPQNRSTE